MHREKQTTIFIHRLALILLALTASWNLFGMVTKPRLGGIWSSQYEQFGFVIGLWALAIWKVWTRPRAWGRGVGIAMLLIVVAHGFLWYRGMQYFRSIGQQMEFVPELMRFLPYEVLFCITGIVCLVLAKRSAARGIELGEMGK